MANTRGGSVGNLRTMSAQDREEAFKLASEGGSWIGASLQSPAAFDDIVQAATETLNGYTTILNTGTALLETNAAIAIAALNPISAVLSELIKSVQDQINDFMGTGFYILFIDGQDDGLSAYGIKKTSPQIKIQRWKTGGMYVDPFTDTFQYSVQRLANIDVIKDSNPALANQYVTNPKKYLIWDGNIFDKTTQKPVFEAADRNLGNSVNISMVNSFNTWRANMQSVPPDKCIQIINQSFDDAGDNERPRFSDSGNVGGLVMIAGVTDPAKLFEKIAKLYNFFSTLEPLRAASEAAKSIRDEIDNFRIQRIRVRNLCAPNKNNLPKLEDVPIDLSKTKSNVRSDWNEYKIGTNSDNVRKYSNRLDITDHKNDKILFKNLRSGQVFQIIKVGKATAIETPISDGAPTDEQSDIQILTQNSTTTYNQEWEALFDTFVPDTLPGDILVEVELDDKYLFYNDEEQPESGENWYDKYNSYCLKNGTKLMAENDDLENDLKIILDKRIENANTAYATSKNKAYEVYSEELNKGTQSKYYDDLKITRAITGEEIYRLQQKNWRDNWINQGQEAPDYDINDSPELRTAQNELENLKAERLKQQTEFSSLHIDTINSQISDLKLTNSSLLQNIADTNQKINSVNADIELLENKISEYETRKNNLIGDFTFASLTETTNYEAKNALDELNTAKNLRDNLQTEIVNLTSSIQSEFDLQWETYYRSQYPEYTDSQIDDLVSAENIDFNQYTEYVSINQAFIDADLSVQIKEQIYNDAIDSVTEELQTMGFDGRRDASRNVPSHEVLTLQIKAKRNEIEKNEIERNRLEGLLNDSNTGFQTNLNKNNTKIKDLEFTLDNRGSELSILDEKINIKNEEIIRIRETPRNYVPGITFSEGEFRQDDVAVGRIVKNLFTDTYEISPESDSVWKDKLNDLILNDPDGLILEKPNLNPDDLEPDDLTSAESQELLGKMFERMNIDIKANPKLYNLIKNKLGGYYFSSRWKGGGDVLPAPRFCIVEAADNSSPNQTGINDTEKTESRYPDWDSYTLEDLIPEFRDILDFVNVFLESLKGFVDGLAEVIQKIVKFIKEKIIPKIAKLIKQLQDWVNLLKIGIVDAGIFFLYIPPQVGGVTKFRQNLVNAVNRPPSNLHFTYSFVLLGGGPQADKSFEVLDKLIALQ